jgi:adenylosuccinate synthase
MPTEIKDETGELIRQRGGEFGTTTGRPRRCGWFDAVAARFSTKINGFTGIALTRLDILDIFPSIKICVGYKVEGEVLSHFPANSALLEKCEPVYEELPGWGSSTTELRHFEELPPAAQFYVRKIEQLLDCPVELVSVGARREQTIQLKPIF